MWYPIELAIELYKLGAGDALDAVLATEVLGEPKPTVVPEVHNNEIVTSGRGWILMDFASRPAEWMPYAFSGPGGWWIIAEHMLTRTDAKPNHFYQWTGPTYMSKRTKHEIDCGFPNEPCWAVFVSYRGIGFPLGGSTPAIAVARAALWLSRMMADAAGPRKADETVYEDGDAHTLETLVLDRAVF